MDKIEYPDRDALGVWVNALNNDSVGLKRYLPLTDNEWLDEMNNVLERAQIFPDTNIHIQAARIFHNAVKNHTFVDGNKRSGVIVVYLFYFWNDFLLRETEVQGEALHKVAQEVADIKGNLNASQMKKLQHQLSELAFKDSLIEIIEEGYID